MQHLRFIDQDGNPIDIETDVIPRIGERVVREFGRQGESVRPHHFEVRDVLYNLDTAPDLRVAILIVEDPNPPDWAGI